jgi:hypothetical protein
MERHQLDVLTEEILARIAKESGRQSDTTKSHLVGGLTMLGSKIDALLRAVLEEVAALQRAKPDAFMPQLNGKAVSFRRAPAGQLLRAIEQASRGLELPSSTRALVRGYSDLDFAIRVRNEVVHEGGVPSRAGEALAKLRALLTEYRRDAGWDRPRRRIV